MGKWAKSDLSDLENDLLNNSMTVDQYHPQEAYTRNKEKLSEGF